MSPNEPVSLGPGTFTANAPPNQFGNYEVTFDRDCSKNCFGYQQHGSGEFLGACTDGTVHGTADPNSLCKGSLSAGVPVIVTTQLTTI